ncbi:secreted RxLR effector protein 161-like [Cryptomeria japonica]|uniref:secreted RxLR effector protein 161-like n=1 Tax=Cryptomeria japonica TaxID=3369 RepID=UPI0027DA8C73|nr:secreted RxLR effector protein 161-like [Cryptomeria japonica]
MVDCKGAPTPFLSRLKLEASCSSPLVDATLYHQLVGSLIYLTHTRPDISYVVGLVSRFMQEPHELHWKAAKRILHYVQGTRNYGIRYAAGTDIDLVGYTDLDWTTDSQDRKSTSGYCFSLGSGPISWSSEKQSAIALSSTEA